MDSTRFNGKTFLMLGSNVLSKEMVVYAKSNGAYTIVADYYDPEKSEAKQVSDESVMISTADMDALDQLIIDKHVDAVFAGISEFNLLKAMHLAQKHGLSFYCDSNQWEKIERKDLFRKLCIKHSVPCPKTYYIGSDLNNQQLRGFVYPLVVKPVDCCSSKGVFICNTESDLRKHWRISLNDSEYGKIIIERFIRGDEFTAHYTIVNGRASLSCIDNRYPVAVHEGHVTTIPVARVYPSTFIGSYVTKVNHAMISLCEDLGLTNGVVFIQGLHNAETDDFAIFEAGLRSAGEAPNRIIEVINGINYMKLLIDDCLASHETTFEQEKEDPYMGGKCCGVISFIGKHGKVGEIIGLEKAVKDTPSVINYECRYPVGSVVPDTDTLRQIMIRFVMICDDRNQMARDIAYLNDHITVLNDLGEDMVIKCDPQRIHTEFMEA